MKALVGLPLYYPHVRVELAEFLADAGALGIEVLPVHHLPTDVARNAVVAAAQRTAVDVVVMADSDCVPAPGSLQAMLQAVSFWGGVVGCPYTVRGGGLGVSVEPGETVPHELPDAGLMPVTNIGTHLICYSTAVFDKIEPPYFEYGYNAGHTALLCSEDYVCHRKLRGAGVRFYCLCGYWAGHAEERVLCRPRSLDKLTDFLN